MPPKSISPAEAATKHITVLPAANIQKALKKLPGLAHDAIPDHITSLESDVNEWYDLVSTYVSALNDWVQRGNTCSGERHANTSAVLAQLRVVLAETSLAAIKEEVSLIKFYKEHGDKLTSKDDEQTLDRVRNLLTRMERKVTVIGEMWEVRELEERIYT